MSKNIFLIIDGNSLTHRAFHAIPLLTTTDGTPTNAVYGFLNMFFKALDKIEPDYIAVAFDKGKTTFRHQDYSDYKSTRKATPGELRSQFPLLKEVLQCLRIKYLELDNYEADDIIGTLTVLAEKNSINVVILTGDRDLLQLVSPRVRVMLTQKGISEIQEYDEGKVWDRYGISPPQITDIKGLMGDASDNIPGVPGIGEKTALKLIQEHGKVEDVIADLEKLPARWRNKINEYKEQALLSKQLATINCQVPINIESDDFRWAGPDYPALLALFSKLEFKTLIRNIIDKTSGGDKKASNSFMQSVNRQAELDVYQVDYTAASSRSELAQVNKETEDNGPVTVELAGTPSGGITAAAIALDNGKCFLLPQCYKAESLNTITEICADPKLKKVCFSGKEAIWYLQRHNRHMMGLHFDITVASYLLNPGQSPKTIQDLALEHFNLVLPSEGDSVLPARADTVMRLYPLLHKKLVELGMDRLYYEVELPLIPVLAEMEIEGVNVNPVLLQEMARETEGQILDLEKEIYDLAGEKFNLNSPKQLGYILFEKMGLPVIKKTKTGYSTDASVLEELAVTQVIAEKILEYRQLAKLKSTYIDGLFNLINPVTGRIHTTYHQDVTATGRLSSSDPNLQNIPIRLEQGRKIRKVFIPSQEGNLILAADYSQIELRILAHMSADPNLVESFLLGQDVHTRTAAEVFHLPIQNVTPELRNRAKAVNFGIVYGISDFGLARDLKVSRSEASSYITSYFERYSGVKRFIDQKIAEAKEKGYATTILNRRRYLPDLYSSNRIARAFGERTAINTPIQGSAADIIKLAMVRINTELKKRHMKTKMILQVHDELIFDVPQDELEKTKNMVKEFMENALQLDVPLLVDIKVGPNWYDVRKV
ncbi:DNA polymerase I [Desulfotruncus alcoholivorax]|uniref:DNA polymerase I n=1 Tax=Desulfotruncus alcoholivorax TaxID=265477 RepID=UPI0004042E57|nr:DNA polymerase I [Desulfotruncus alcoholivorax]